LIQSGTAVWSSRMQRLLECEVRGLDTQGKIESRA
jgi:hypothetical protein